MGFPNHRITHDGTVWSCAKKWQKGKWRLVKSQMWNDDGRYLTIVLTHKRHEETHKIHHLVLRAFVGPCPDGMMACHYDDDQLNNNVKNLRWGTNRDNVDDKIRNGKTLVGVKNHKAKLDEDDIIRIRQQYGTGEYSQSQLGKINKVGQDTISSIVRYETWKHVK